MKKPRDILLTRHQTAVPRLDAIRRSVLGELNNQETKEQSALASFVALMLRCPNKLWQELIWPSRRIWAGLAVAWIGILVVNFSQRDPSPVMAMKSPSATIMLTYRQQERLLAELTGPDELRAVEPPKRVLPRPRSERDFGIFTT